MPTGSVQIVSFASNGTHLAVGGSSNPYAWIYKRTNDTFEKISVPPLNNFIDSGIPGSTVRGIAWSADSLYLAMACSNFPRIAIYKRNGSTFSRLADPGNLPQPEGFGIAWSPDMQYLIVTSTATSPYHLIYKRVNDQFTKIPDLPTTPAGGGGSVAWSPDGVYLAICHANSPYTSIYKSSMGSPGGIVVSPTVVP
jgi:WD40 repeat protein